MSEEKVPMPMWMADTSWRESGRQVKVGPFDGRLMLFLVLLLFFPSWVMLWVTIASMIFFYILDYMGYTMPNALRKIRIIISGSVKSGVHYWRKNKYGD